MSSQPRTGARVVEYAPKAEPVPASFVSGSRGAGCTTVCVCAYSCRCPPNRCNATSRFRSPAENRHDCGRSAILAISLQRHCSNSSPCNHAAKGARETRQSRHLSTLVRCVTPRCRARADPRVRGRRSRHASARGAGGVHRGGCSTALCDRDCREGRSTYRCGHCTAHVPSRGSARRPVVVSAAGVFRGR